MYLLSSLASNLHFSDFNSSWNSLDFIKILYVKYQLMRFLAFWADLNASM